MRPESEYRAALDLMREGLNDSEIARRLVIPRGTIRDWRQGQIARSGGRTKHFNGRRTGACFRCDGGWVDEEAYVYLLGVYLGDGWIWEARKGLYQLRVSCDLKYPDIINEIATHIIVVRGVDHVGFALREGCVDVNAHWKHWCCLFPQHGPGRKHERPIRLEPWQEDFVRSHPEALVRGLIHSDGNRHINPIVKVLASGPKTYRYPRYMFTNASDDIREIFTDALARLGVHWTKTTERVVAVSRRDDVAFLDSIVGPKT